MTSGAGWKVELVVPAGVADTFADALAEAGVAVSLFAAADGGGVRLRGYGTTPLDAAEPAMRRLIATTAAALGIATPPTDIVWLPDIDWLAANREGFAPIRAGRFYVHDSAHDAPPPAASIGILIDAATAFGTGAHATTYACLELIDRLGGQRCPGGAPRTLDLGCGTAILAIAAAKRLGGSIVAADINTEAVRLARANVRRNRVAGGVRVVPSDGVRAPAIAAGAPFDLIVANILARPLVRLAPALGRHLAPGGRIILSGVLASQAAGVAAAYRHQRLFIEQRVLRDGWATLLMCRRPAARSKTARRSGGPSS